jgi:hypothetical protein
MGYTVEISINVLKHGNIFGLREIIETIAIENNCTHYYHMYEMEKNLAIQRNHCIIAVAFEDSEVMNCAKFIKYMKEKFKGVVYLECIYEDNAKCKLIYASPCYLKQVEKDKVTKYNQYKRERSHSENELMLLEAGGKYTQDIPKNKTGASL